MLSLSFEIRLVLIYDSFLSAYESSFALDVIAETWNRKKSPKDQKYTVFNPQSYSERIY